MRHRCPLRSGNRARQNQVKSYGESGATAISCGLAASHWSTCQNFSTVLASKSPIMNQKSTIREARLRPEYGVLYPRLEPGVWTPADKMTERVLALASGSGRPHSTGRPLNDHHFEFRGSSPRDPDGPIGMGRTSDTVDGRHTGVAEREEREHRLAAREREADEGVHQAEELQARVEHVTEELERLRRQAEQPDAGKEQ
jgi:hypothetical protein